MLTNLSYNRNVISRNHNIEFLIFHLVTKIAIAYTRYSIYAVAHKKANITHNKSPSLHYNMGWLGDSSQRAGSPVLNGGGAAPTVPPCIDDIPWLQVTFLCQLVHWREPILLMHMSSVHKHWSFAGNLVLYAPDSRTANGNFWPQHFSSTNWP